MAKVINCPCGYTVRGDSDEALLAEAHKHIESEHPDQVGKVSDEELLGSAQEE
jgi:predicted small metal-binding protein